MLCTLCLSTMKTRLLGRQTPGKRVAILDRETGPYFKLASICSVSESIRRGVLGQSHCHYHILHSTVTAQACTRISTRLDLTCQQAASLLKRVTLSRQQAASSQPPAPPSECHQAATPDTRQCAHGTAVDASDRTRLAHPASTGRIRPHRGALCRTCARAGARLSLRSLGGTTHRTCKRTCCS